MVCLQEAVQALQDMSGAVFETDGSGMIQQTIEGPDGQQTVIILQVWHDFCVGVGKGWVGDSARAKGQ